MTIEEKIVNNINDIKITYVAEDEQRPATMMELQRAITLARPEEKEIALKKSYIPFEDGYITIKFRKGGKNESL